MTHDPRPTRLCPISVSLTVFQALRFHCPRWPTKNRLYRLQSHMGSHLGPTPRPLPQLVLLLFQFTYFLLGYFSEHKTHDYICYCSFFDFKVYIMMFVLGRQTSSFSCLFFSVILVLSLSLNSMLFICIPVLQYYQIKHTPNLSSYGKDEKVEYCIMTI